MMHSRDILRYSGRAFELIVILIFRAFELI